MSLPTGQYKIVSQAGDRPVGRLPNEDRSLRPKKIVVLPKDFDRPRIWQIDQLANGKYKLSTGGAVVGKLPDNLVWAFLIPEEIRDAEWTLTHVPQHGENAYIIETADESNGDGWVVGEEDNSQVAVRLLILGPREPPVYPLNEVFNIVPVSQD